MLNDVTMSLDAGSLISNVRVMAALKNVKQGGFLEVFKTNKNLTNKQIALQLVDLVFAWLVNWQRLSAGTSFTWTSKQLSFKDKNMTILDL